MADNNYNSQYTGAQIDSAYADKPEAVSGSELANGGISPAGKSANKIYIIKDDSAEGQYSMGTLWRSNGTTWVQIGGSSSGGGGGGTDISAVTSPYPNGVPLYGLRWGTSTPYTIIQASLEARTGLADEYTLVFN